jgi:putative NADPH-quinone reductase
MNVLLVVAHPEPSSYNAYLAGMARDTLLKEGNPRPSRYRPDQAKYKDHFLHRD